MPQVEMTESEPGTPEVTVPTLAERFAEVEALVRRELWRANPEETVLRRGLRAMAQLIVLTVRGFHSDQLLLRASALTYVTALSIIPMLGVVIAIVGVVGGDETLVEFAIDYLTTVAPEARETVREFAGRLDFARFGTVGGAVVFGTTIFALRHLEATLNHIWGVPSARSWARRFADYLAVMVVAPVSTGVAVSLATTLQSGRVVGWLLQDPTFAWLYGLGLAQLPVIVLFLGFTFLFWFFPNTKVRIRAAALGGLVSAILFSAAQTLYVDFQVGAATYETVFGALSAIPLILVWLYACWAVLLLGAEVAFAAQNLAFARREMRYGDAGTAEQETVAVQIAVAIARSFRAHATPPDAGRLADDLDEPVRLVRRICIGLAEAGLVLPVATVDGKDPGYVPAGPVTAITVGAVLRAARGGVYGLGDTLVAGGDSVAELMARLEVAWGGVADETSLAMLCEPSETELSP
ncbi:MAG: YhjD/YihY/BrkB family envelope integrity protein [Myxococcota bacterium]